MKKFFLVFSSIILTLLISFLLVSFIVANVHDVSVVEEWKSWLAGILFACKTIKKWFIR